MWVSGLRLLGPISQNPPAHNRNCSPSLRPARPRRCLAYECNVTHAMPVHAYTHTHTYACAKHVHAPPPSPPALPSSTRHVAPSCSPVTPESLMCADMAATLSTASDLRANGRRRGALLMRAVSSKTAGLTRHGHTHRGSTF